MLPAKLTVLPGVAVIELTPLRVQTEELPALSIHMFQRIRSSGSNYPGETSQEVLKVMPSYN